MKLSFATILTALCLYGASGSPCSGQWPAGPVPPASNGSAAYGASFLPPPAPPTIGQPLVYYEATAPIPNGMNQPGAANAAWFHGVPYGSDSCAGCGAVGLGEQCACAGGCTGAGCGVCGDPCACGGGGPLARIRSALDSRYQGYATPHLGSQHGPFGTGGCCLPRWFDVHAEWIFWKRDDVELDQDLTSQGILGPGVLNMNDLDFEETSGFRVTGALPFGPAGALELSYLGTFNWNASAAVTSANDDLFSVFSQFGSSPLNGFPETDQANLHSLAYSTALNNGELNLRRRWVSDNCLLHGSWLVGVRYLALDEDLIHFTRTPNGQLQYLLETENDLVGVQIGTDLFVCLTPRCKVGGEVEAGVYGNRARQITQAAGLTERLEDDDAAFIGEAGVIGLFRVTPRLTYRFGYQVLYLTGVALAPDNFNTASPFAARTAFLDNDGDAIYYGATSGFEWTW